MGYETKMFIVQVPDLMRRGDLHPLDNGLLWASPIAMVDLCKTGYDSFTYQLIQRQMTDEPFVYMFADDGDTQLSLDQYGSPFGVIKISDMIAALERDMKVDEDVGLVPYRRFVIARDLLESVAKTFDTTITYVVTYGH